MWLSPVLSADNLPSMPVNDFELEVLSLAITLLRLVVTPFQ